MPRKNSLFFFISLILLSLIYFISRIYHLTNLPVFADEAIYIRWSQIIKNVETLRFIPLSDGKQPFFMWLVVPFLKIFSDPLFAGRITTVISGFFLSIGLVLLFSIISTPPKPSQQNPLLYLFHSLVASFPQNLIPLIIYIFSPFSFFYDRLATADTLLSAFGVWSLLLTFLLYYFSRFDISIMLGTVLGLAWITKSPAIYFFVLSFGTILFLSLLHTRKKLISNLIFISISLLIGFVIYNILRLGPQFHMIALRNQDYVWSLSDVLSHPLDPLKPHLSDIVTIFSYYYGLPLILLSIAGLLYLIASNLRSHKSNLSSLIILLAWGLLPLIANAAIAKVFTTRYILFILPPIIILSSLSIHKLISRNRLFSILLIFSISSQLFKLYQMSFTPQNLSLPAIDQGYVVDWTSGWGIKEVSQYLKQRSLEANVIVGSEGYFGTLPDGLQIYTDGTPQLTIVGVGIDITSIPSNLLEAKAYGDEVYLLFNQSRLKLPSSLYDELSIIKSYNKPDNDKLLLIKI